MQAKNSFIPIAHHWTSKDILTSLKLSNPLNRMTRYRKSKIYIQIHKVETLRYFFI